jgi:hypothetical protein
VVQNQPAQSEVRWVHFVDTRRMSVRIDSFSPKDHTLTNARAQKPDSERTTRHGDAPWRLPRLSRDHCAPISLGGAEFYPSCTQILVGGSQTGTPNQTVSFLGAYNDNDPGICDPSLYHNTSHIFLGPPLSNPASLSSGTGSDVGPSSPTAT